MRHKRLIMLAIVFIIGMAGFYIIRRSTVATYEDYERCVKAGGTTQESNPPTCFHPNGTRVTPGR